jgi:A/G-specific adenine glycosylase
MDSVDKYIGIREILLNWYKENKREYPWRKSNSLYQILLTEILLQKTIAVNVSNIYSDFFNKYIDFNSINSIDITELQSDIKGLGLSKKRAKILKDLSKLIVKKYNGKIPQDSDVLKEVNGIADYVSNAFACFGLNHRTFFFDVNIKRIILRIFKPHDIKIKPEEIYSELDRLLPSIDFKYLYWAILDFGNKVCTKNNPKCDLCPIANCCCYFLNQI